MLVHEVLCSLKVSPSSLVAGRLDSPMPLFQPHGLCLQLQVQQLVAAIEICVHVWTLTCLTYIKMINLVRAIEM